MRRANDIPAALINVRINIAESFGADREVILNHAGIDGGIFADSQSRVSVEQAMKVWEAIATETGLETMGLESGLRVRMQYLGILGYVMMNSQSMKAAYQKLCNYQRLVASVIFQNLEEEGELIKLRGEMQVPWQDDFKYTIDFVYAGNYAVIKNSTAKEIEPIKMGFNYPEPDDRTRYDEIFGQGIVEFDCDEPYMIYRKSDLESPVVGTSPEMFAHFEIKLEEELHAHDQVNQLTREVKKLILDGLKADTPKIEMVAREMAVSKRSLQSGLKDEGTSYQSLLNDVRKEISMSQLKNSQFNVTDVAFLTGFSDVAVFSRNFKKWTGLTPTQYQTQRV